MTPTLRIEPLDHARPEVAAAIHHVMRAAYAVEAELLGATDFFPLSRTPEHLAASSSRFLGARAGRRGTLVGVVELELVRGESTNVASLVVRPDRFRRGIATALLERVEREHGAGPITVSTGLANAPALALYAARGFTDLCCWSTDDGIAMVTLLRAAASTPPAEQTPPEQAAAEESPAEPPPRSYLRPGVDPGSPGASAR